MRDSGKVNFPNLALFNCGLAFVTDSKNAGLVFTHQGCGKFDGNKICVRSLGNCSGFERPTGIGGGKVFWQLAGKLQLIRRSVNFGLQVGECYLLGNCRDTGGGETIIHGDGRFEIRCMSGGEGEGKELKDKQRE